MTGSIFVLESDEVARQGLEAMLKVKGYQVVSYATLAALREAERDAEIYAPKLLICGKSLSDGEGIAAREIPSFARLPMIVTMTATTGEEITRLGRSGADGVLLQPFADMELKVEIQEAAKRRAARNRRESASVSIA